MKNYATVLKEVKDKNPKLSHREAQITASTIFQEQKETEVKAHIAIPKQPMAKSYVNPDAVETEIRRAGVNKHNIQVIAKNFAHGFEFKIAGKDGVNSLVYLDGPCRVPRTGFFKVWI